MPKLRNAPTELGALTQWIGRKCKNHHPLSELGVTEKERAKLGRTYRKTEPASILAAGSQRNVVVYRTGGRLFTIKVEEVVGYEAEQEVNALLQEGVDPIGS